MAWRHVRWFFEDPSLHAGKGAFRHRSVSETFKKACILMSILSRCVSNLTMNVSVEKRRRYEFVNSALLGNCRPRALPSGGAKLRRRDSLATALLLMFKDVEWHVQHPPSEGRRCAVAAKLTQPKHP